MDPEISSCHHKAQSLVIYTSTLPVSNSCLLLWKDAFLLFASMQLQCLHFQYVDHAGSLLVLRQQYDYHVFIVYVQAADG